MLRGQRHQSGCDRKVQDRGDHDLAPADLVGDPAPDQRAERGAHSRRQQYRRPLAVGQIPVLDDKRQNERDQQKIEEVEHVADRRRGEYLPLIDGELLLPLQMFEHRFAPPTPIFDCAVAACRKVLDGHSPSFPLTAGLSGFCPAIATNSRDAIGWLGSLIMRSQLSVGSLSPSTTLRKLPNSTSPPRNRGSRRVFEALAPGCPLSRARRESSFGGSVRGHRRPSHLRRPHAGAATGRRFLPGPEVNSPDLPLLWGLIPLIGRFNSAVRPRREFAHGVTPFQQLASAEPGPGNRFLRYFPAFGRKWDQRIFIRD